MLQTVRECQLVGSSTRYVRFRLNGFYHKLSYQTSNAFLLVSKLNGVIIRKIPNRLQTDLQIVVDIEFPMIPGVGGVPIRYDDYIDMELNTIRFTFESVYDGAKN